jgi:ubiquinone/menaquinone biosynthesis C-methylase UbiE
MQAELRSTRNAQLVAWTVAGLFLIGLFFSPVGAWTGPILGTWFVCTQRPLRGFTWMLAVSFLFSLPATGRIFSQTVLAHGPAQTLDFLGTVFVSLVLPILPFTFHRLVSSRLPGFFSTLPLPLAAMAFPAMILWLHLGAVSQNSLHAFLIFWLAAIIVWLWRLESRATALVFGTGALLAAALELSLHFAGAALSPILPPNNLFNGLCLCGALLLSLWALFNSTRKKSWADRPQTVARLQSPFTGQALKLVSDAGREALVSNSGEHFPIRNGIPAFLQPEDLTGDNGKYNHLYEVIGGFYDDTQRVFLALKGFNREYYFRSYMSLLEAKAGDAVLETSVGTGLNYKYLPDGVQLSGLDLSPEMLANCQSNLQRWQLDADLYLGNAESLPFADASFDVVFHVGGINFFNDRAKAIREMIRVARPGSLLLIADETEKHVKEIYEKGPGGHLFKNRKAPVSAPIDLVPPEMQQIHLEEMRTGDWYALTFRKPTACSK